MKKKGYFYLLFNECARRSPERIFIGLSQMIQRHFNIHSILHHLNSPAIKIHQRPNKTLMVLPYQYPQKYSFLAFSSDSAPKESAKQKQKNKHKK